MPKYAHHKDGRVVGWYDTDIVRYPQLPQTLHELSEREWQDRLIDPAGFCITDGRLMRAVRPPPSLAERALAALRKGLTVAVDDKPPTVLSVHSRVVAGLHLTGKFPGNAETYPLKDRNGDWHHLSTKQYLAVAQAISDYMSRLQLIAEGNPMNETELPHDMVTISTI